MTAVRTSVVVVSYDMARVLPRTILSLAPPYQAPVPGGLEIIIVDNGSPVPPRREDFAVDVPLSVVAAPEPSPSPVGAINHGLSLARGDVIGVWIDGARLASPGLVAACTAVCTANPGALAATPNYHLGHAPQYVRSAAAYSEAEEDALLASIGWPENGARLFEIAAPADASGVGTAMLETNALFMARALWERLGGYEPRFTSAGGGAANPDLFLRALALPDTTLTLIDGEATFHQIHGGVTSNAPDVFSVMKALSAEYFRVRGRALALWRGEAQLYDPATGTLTPHTVGDRKARAAATTTNGPGAARAAAGQG